MKKTAFSKLLLTLESFIVLYTTLRGFAIAELAITANYAGALPWITGMVSAAWGAYGTSAAFYYNKTKAENTAGGIVYEAACRGQQDCEARG